MSNKNKIIRLELIKIYGKICMLNEPLTKKNYITLHHILKRELGGKTSIENGALLSRLMHEYLHFIENWYYGEYDYINEYLIIRNSCKRCPKNRICEESDRDERDKGRQDKKLSNFSIQEWKPNISKKRI